MPARSLIRTGAALDMTVAVAVCALELSHLLAFDAGDRYDGLTIVLLGLASLPLLAWRRYPTLCLQITGWATIALAVRDDPHLGLGPIAATFAVANWEDRARARWFAAGSLAIAVWLVPILTADQSSIPTNAAFFGAAWILGALTRDRRRQTMALEARTVELAQEREAKTALAAEAERSRIAQELHDVLTHSVTVMVVQAQAGQAAAPDPTAMVRALSRVERIGQQTLAELRGLLRRVEPLGDSAAREPQPSLDRLDELVSSVRSAGVEVSLTRQGMVREVAPTVALSAYRIVQEALTNTLRHTPGSHARVRLDYGATELAITVQNDGTGAGPDTAGEGKGLAGMRDRAAAVGGSLAAGPDPAGGFQVVAMLPLAASR
jgi:signal transduction histidine kinase